MTVDGLGTPFAGGGLSAGLRDLGRVGLVMLNEGFFNGQRLFPAEVVSTEKPIEGRSISVNRGTLKGTYWLIFLYPVFNRQGQLAQILRTSRTNSATLLY